MRGQAASGPFVFIFMNVDSCNPPVFPRPEHGPWWPTPSSSVSRRCWRYVFPIFSMLCWNPTEAEAASVLKWAWAQVDHRRGIECLEWAVAVVINRSFPADGPARRSPRGLLCMAHLFVVLAALRLRRAQRSSRRRFPRWAARVLRLLPDGWVTEMCSPQSAARQAVWDALGGRLPTVRSPLGASGSVAVVYTLFNKAGVYIGKANIQRKVHAGLPYRLWEHLHALMHPRPGPGRMARYRLLREQLWGVSFVPCILAETEPKAFSMEAFAIRSEQPLCNAAEKFRYGTRPTKLAHKGQPRQRPSSWRRARTTPWASIWSRAQTWTAAFRDKSGRFPELVGVNSVDGAFTSLYRLHQKENFEQRQCVGPVWLWSLQHSVLLLSYMASRRPTIFLPKWRRFELAEFLFRLVRVMEVAVPIHSRRLGMRKQIAFLLRSLHLRLVVPVFVIPAGMGMAKGKALVRRLLRGIVNEIRCAPYREWILDHMRVRLGPTPKWKQAVNANKRFLEMEFPAEEVYGNMRVRYPQHMQVLPGNWGLPQWPTEKLIAHGLTKAWRAWARELCLPGRVHGLGSRRVQNLFARISTS